MFVLVRQERHEIVAVAVEQLELPPCGCMPPPTSQVALYIHVSRDSCNTCREDFEGLVGFVSGCRLDCVLADIML